MELSIVMSGSWYTDGFKFRMNNSLYEGKTHMQINKKQINVYIDTSINIYKPVTWKDFIMIITVSNNIK